MNQEMRGGKKWHAIHCEALAEPGRVCSGRAWRVAAIGALRCRAVPRAPLWFKICRGEVGFTPCGLEISNQACPLRSACFAVRRRLTHRGLPLGPLRPLGPPRSQGVTAAVAVSLRNHFFLRQIRLCCVNARLNLASAAKLDGLARVPPQPVHNNMTVDNQNKIFTELRHIDM